MKITLVVPFDSSCELKNEIITEAGALRAASKSSAPFLVDNELTSDLHLEICEQRCFLARLFSSKKGRKNGSLRIRVSNGWAVGLPRISSGLNLVSDRATGSISIEGHKATGTPHRLRDADFEEHLALLPKVAQLIMQAIECHPALLADSRVSDTDAGRLADTLATGIKDLRIVHMGKKADQDAQIRARRDLLATLPDGTPLAVRSSRYASVYSLGLKGKSVTLDLANNARVPTTQELMHPDVTTAGMSKHQLLPLVSLAAKAHAIAPELGLYHEGETRNKKAMKLDAGQPFHPSFGEAEMSAQRWAEGPRIWVSTNTSHRPRRFLINGNPKQTVLNSVRDRLGKYLSPNIDPAPGSESDLVRFLTEVPFRPESAYPRRDIDWLSDLLVVSEKAAAVLWAHDLGKNELRPLPIFSAEGELEAMRSYRLIIREKRDSLLLDRMPKKFAYGLYSPVKDFLVKIAADTVVGPDLWCDPKMSGGRNLFFSDTLVKALTKAGVHHGLSFKRCDPL